MANTDEPVFPFGTRRKKIKNSSKTIVTKYQAVGYAWPKKGRYGKFYNISLNVNYLPLINRVSRIKDPLNLLMLPNHKRRLKSNDPELALFLPYEIIEPASNE